MNKPNALKAVAILSGLLMVLVFPVGHTIGITNDADTTKDSSTIKTAPPPTTTNTYQRPAHGYSHDVQQIRDKYNIDSGQGQEDVGVTIKHATSVTSSVARTTDITKLPPCPASADRCSNINLRGGGTADQCPETCKVDREEIGWSAVRNAPDSIRAAICPSGYVQLHSSNMKPEYKKKDWVYKPYPIPSWSIADSYMRTPGMQCWIEDVVYVPNQCVKKTSGGPSDRYLTTQYVGNPAANGVKENVAPGYGSGIFYGAWCDGNNCNAGPYKPKNFSSNCYQDASCSTPKKPSCMVYRSSPPVKVCDRYPRCTNYDYYKASKPALMFRCRYPGGLMPTGHHVPATVTCGRVKDVWK